MNEIIFLILILILAIGLPIFFKISKSMKLMEGYSNYTLAGAIGNLPNAESDVLVQDTFPITHINGISNDTSNKIWWHYPIFKVGSYSQITNNIRYPNNPDEGTCMPASMCGALYKEIHNKSNYVKPLPPIDPNSGTRVGYFSTLVNLLPFRTNIPNILY
uniref:Uncharacterized protein n=1 Tax=viral metagenome TaxID=1070528 RepID=A0A6C0ESA7_9ZZZZ